MTDPNDLPRDAKLISLILGSSVDQYDPQVVPMLYEFMHRYTLDIVRESQLISNHCSTPITPECIKLAIEQSNTIPVNQSVLNDLALKKNRIPLPLVGEKFGIRLPPERHLLNKQNFVVQQVYPGPPVKKLSAPHPAPRAQPQQQAKIAPLVAVPITAKPMVVDEDDDYDDE